MKTTKLTVLLAVAGFLGLASVTHALVVVPFPAETYVFEAAPGYTTAFNGSMITIDGYPAGPYPWEPGASYVIGYDFVDTDVSPTAYSSGTVLNDNITSFDTSGWVGDFTVDVGSGITFDATGTSLDEYSAGAAVDPPGTWTYVPDASATFPLLLGGLAALAGLRQKLSPGK